MIGIYLCDDEETIRRQINTALERKILIENYDTVNICAVSSEPDCLERKKLTEGLPLLRRTIPALQSLVWKIKD